MARFVLLRRLPRLGRFPDLYEPIVHEREYVKFPDLARDFSILDDQLSPLFIKLDNVALAQQNRFRLQQLTFLAGGTLVAILSALQTIITGPWLGIGQAVSALALAYVSIITRDDDSLERAVDCR